MTPAIILTLALQSEGALDPPPPPRPEKVEAPVEAPPAVKPRLRDPNIVIPAVHSLALMTGMRVTESVIWPQPFSQPQYFGDHYKDAFTKKPIFDTHKPFMEWDGDPWPINTFGHGLFGSELYLRARQCRFGWAGSLAFAAATSGLWEYAFEGNGSRPSALDLIYTPLAGALFGELRFFVHGAAKNLSSPALRTVVRAVVDPLGEIERAAGTDC